MDHASAPQAITMDDMRDFVSTFHDADLKVVQLLWDSDGRCAIVLSTEIHYEENPATVEKYGVAGLDVDVVFCPVYEVNIVLYNACSDREVILDWAYAPSDTGNWSQHTIGCSCGALYTIAVENIFVCATGTGRAHLAAQGFGTT